MYIPKFKQTKPLYTEGNLFLEELTGKSYTGFYIRTSKGEYYSGTFYERGISQKLVLKQTISTSSQVFPEDYDIVKQDNIALSLKLTEVLPDYVATRRDDVVAINRYFAQKKSDNSIQEISNETYVKLLTQDTQYHYPSYRIVEIKWFINGPLEDTFQNGVLREGIIVKNNRQIIQGEKIIYGLSSFITPTQLSI